MRIERKKKDRRPDPSLRDGIRDVLEGGVGDARPCGIACQIVCETCGSTACQCSCSRACGNIPTVLSSDPDDHPLETLIAPVVYELNRTGYLTPCWSCEGHLHKDGSLWKTPRVWFYCKSVVHLRLLAEALKEMHIQKWTSVPWRVGVTFSDPDNPDTTFTLEPDPNGTFATLASLQKDIAAIAEHLGPELRTQALNLSRSTQTKL